MSESVPVAEPFYADAHFWAFVAFLLFIGVFFKYIRPPLNKALDARANGIANQLEQANRLRAEAEKLLAASKLQQEAMLHEAEAILAQAKKDAHELTNKAAVDLDQSIARRVAQADEKITRAEINAVAGLRAQMVEVATETARQVIIAHQQNQQEDTTILLALESIERQMH